MPADGGTPRQVKARYEAGYPSDYNASPPVSRAPDAEVYSAGARLRDWARYLARNSAIVKAVLDARQAKGVGTGLRYEPMIKDRSGEPLTKLNDAIRAAHAVWSESCDTTGELSRVEIERLAWREWDTAGEVFARLVYRGRTAESIGYQLQPIRSELVPYAVWSDTGATLGVERDDWGKPKNYWVLPYSPADFPLSWGLPASQPQPVSASAMAHLRRQSEIGQTRGITLLHAVIFRISDIAEFQQSHRRAARASANLFASVNRSVEMIGATQAGTQAEAKDDSRDPFELNLGDLQVLDWLKPGEAVNFHAPAHPNQNAVEFTNQELRQIAAACRVAFSWIAYVFDRAYAAQRTELVHAWEMILEDRAHFVRDFAFPYLYRRPVQMMIAEGRLPARELRKADPASLFAVRIDGPAMPSIDPVSDRQSAELDQQNGWESRQGIIRRFGRDPAQVDLEREQDNFAPSQAQSNKPSRPLPSDQSAIEQANQEENLV